VSTNDPPFLKDAGSGAPESLRALFDAGTRDLPTAEELARVEAKLAPLFTPPVAAPSPASSGTGALVKAGLAVIGGAIVAGGLWFATRPSVEPAPQKPTPPAAPAPAAPEAANPPAVVPPSATEAPSAAEPEAPVTADKPKSAAAPKPAPVPEDVLLEQARRALGSDPKRALSLSREHEASYPGGVLTQEREVIAIEALRRLGRTDEAARRLERFERLFPKSAHRRKLEQPSK
jgi:hypothetical protein